MVFHTHKKLAIKFWKVCYSNNTESSNVDLWGKHYYYFTGLQGVGPTFCWQIYIQV